MTDIGPNRYPFSSLHSEKEKKKEEKTSRSRKTSTEEEWSMQNLRAADEKFRYKRAHGRAWWHKALWALFVWETVCP